MDEKEVRTLFFEHWAKRQDGKQEEAVAQTYFAVAMRIIASLEVPCDNRAYWETVQLAMGLKTDLCRKEMYPGPKGLDPVPFGQDDQVVLLRVLDAERQVLRYLIRNQAHLPPSPFKDNDMRNMVESGLESRRLERERVVHDYIVKQFVFLPRSRIDGLARHVDDLIQALLGVPACEQFCREFDAACAWIRQEQDRPVGPVN